VISQSAICEAGPRPTLRQVFGLSLLGLLLGLALLFYLVLDGSQQSILHSAERYRELASRQVAEEVTTYLNEAPMAVTHYEQQIKYGLTDTKNPDSIERGLLTLLLSDDNISEATLTYAHSMGFDSNGNILTDPVSAGQVLRSSTAGEYASMRTWFSGTQFVSRSVTLSQDVSAKASSPAPIASSIDPTTHPTFQTTAGRQYYGQIIPTDLHWSQIDEKLPEANRRIEVSVQTTVEDSNHNFVGVLRVGLMKSEIDGAVERHITGPGNADPHLIFICDKQGRLITGFGNRNHIVVSGDDLRLAPEDVPPIVERAVKEKALQEIDSIHPDMDTTSSFHLDDKIYLCTFRFLPGTQDWIVGIVVPRDFYLGKLVEMRKHVLVALLILIALMVSAGAWILRSVVRSHALILRETAQMNKFEFAATHSTSYLEDVKEVLVGLEKAKTAMRAMSKYVPVELVRQLYHDGEEPTLGGKSCELSVLFTDIKNFTALAESMPAAQLAEVLGRYMEVMANAIQKEKGTIDKYIGDAVMTFWNAPEPVLDHEILACRSALNCRAALQTLFDSSTWGSAPRFETRFGLHRCIATVGHFGAPDRLNYTAIGDGINLTSRLEGLNKYYETDIIASESIYAFAREAFEFRLLDRVSVKGKTEGIIIYELVSEKGVGQRPAHIDDYEQAFALYQHADFIGAVELLERHPRDLPSQVLASRCRDWISHPPSHPWTGIYRFASK
jgi:adenylate cyclase